MEFGLFKQGAMGAAPMEWTDIESWVNLMHINLHPEEVKTIRDASHVYVNWLSKSKAMDCPAPYPDVVLNAKI